MRRGPERRGFGPGSCRSRARLGGISGLYFRFGRASRYFRPGCISGLAVFQVCLAVWTYVFQTKIGSVKKNTALVHVLVNTALVHVLVYLVNLIQVQVYLRRF